MLIKSLRNLRKELHEHPEMAFHEMETRSIIERFLAEQIAGNPEFTVYRLLETGLVIEYRGATVPDEPFFVFRADMDALPIAEDPSHPVVSKRPGFMHACGHDLHMTVLAGFIARVAREKPRRNILFVFQPGEEGAGGAKRMLETGFFDPYPVAAAYAFHVTDDYPIGTVATRAGVLFAMSREIDVTLTGTAAHAAFPQKGSDAILAAAHFLTTLPVLLAKKRDPVRPFLCHFGRIEGGVARNVTADRCLLEGTLRALDRETMEIGTAIVEEAARFSASLFGGSSHVEVLGDFLPVVCDAKRVEHFRKVCASMGIQYVDAPAKMVGEDFGFFCDRWPSLLFWLGTRREGEAPHELHTPAFYPPDDVVGYGIAIFAGLLSAPTTDVSLKT